MVRRHFVMSSLLAALVVSVRPATDTARLYAQAPTQPAAPAGTLTLGAVAPEVRDEFFAALDTRLVGASAVALEHANKAVALDPHFGLARAWRAWLQGGPTTDGEMTRAAADAMRVSTPHAMIVLGLHAELLGRTAAAAQMLEAAMKAYPNDARIAVIHDYWTLAGEPRLTALRELAKRFPDFLPAKNYFVYALISPLVPTVAPEVADEALRVAQDAVRQGPDVPGAQAILAVTYARLGRLAEAKVALARATASSSSGHYPYVLTGEIAIREMRWSDARAALERAAQLDPLLVDKYAYRRGRDLTFLSEGNLRAAVDGLEATARNAEEHFMTGQANATYQMLAEVAAATYDVAGVDRYLSQARRLGLAPATAAIDAVYDFSVAGDGARARAALTDWIGRTKATTTVAHDNAVKIATALTLVAEKHPAEALDLFKTATGPNQFILIGQAEAYRQLGRNAEADATRKQLLARPDVGYDYTTLPIVRYRAFEKK